MSADTKFLAISPLTTQTAPAANYSNAVVAGKLMYLSGKIPLPGADGKVARGILGREYNVDQGYAFARSAAMDLIAVMRAEVGSLEKIKRVIKLQAFIRASEDFEEHPKVLNGASDLMVEIFGERGVHARSVLGATSLRGGSPIVIEAIVELF